MEDFSRLTSNFSLHQSGMEGHDMAWYGGKIDMHGRRMDDRDLF